MKLAFGAIAIGLALVVLTSFAAASDARETATPSPSVSAVKVALAARLPKTKITSVRCDKLGGLCEVAAGNTLFYTDARARYLVIGRVYDMQTRSDLTAARLLEISPSTLLGAAARSDDGPAGEGRATPAGAASVPLGELPKSGAIAWGPVGAPKVVVFSDFRCAYCAKLSQTLASMNVRVEERPISVLGSRSLSEKVYCAADPVAALHTAYQHGEVGEAKACDTAGLDANEAFAKKHGFAGTPVVVRADGAVIEGFRPAPELTAWLKAKPAA